MLHKKARVTQKTYDAGRLTSAHNLNVSEIIRYAAGVGGKKSTGRRAMAGADVVRT